MKTKHFPNGGEMNQKGFTIIEILIVIIVVVILGAVVIPQLKGCTDSPESTAAALKTARVHGFNDTTIVNSDNCFFELSCKKGETYFYSMTGYNTSKQQVSFTVYCSYLSGCSLRIR